MSDDNLITKYEDYLKFIPVGIARIEKVIVEAAMIGRLSLEKEELDVVVKEDVIPCSALAFADLAMMYDHLCALSREYDQRKFPKVNLHIISPKNDKSPFHLGNPAYSSSKKLNREKEYDLVRTKHVAVKPQTVDEAILQMNMLGHEFYMFINEATGLVSVVYCRIDGGYGLLEPSAE